MQVQENLNHVERLLTIVKYHPVDGWFVSCDENKIKFLFKDTWSGLNGVQVSLDNGKINALKLLIEKLDQLYNKECDTRLTQVKLNSLLEIDLNGLELAELKTN